MTVKEQIFVIFWGKNDDKTAIFLLLVVDTNI